MIESIIYEDNHLLVIEKSSGLLTQPDGSDSDSLEDLCKQYIKEKKQKEGNVFLHAVHRLDKPVSGIVLFAKTDKALSRLNESIRNKDCKKIYRALLENSPPEKEGTLEHFLIHDRFKAQICSEHAEGAKKCILHYKVLESEKGRTLVEIDLITGRYHQIRAQFSASGCPVAGDLKYGAKHSLPAGEIALKHTALTIRHPVSREFMTFRSPFAHHLYPSL